MCIAIYRPKGASLTKKTLWNCWMGNQDGAGFMYAQGGRLHIEKGFFKFKPFWKAVRPHLFEDDKDVVLHFRIATSGKVDEENCHPHAIHPDLAYVHNGIISDLNDDKNVCDTIRFAEILKSLPMDFIKRPELLGLIEMAVGTSRMVFMSGDGDVAFINKESGIESEKVWYSNGGFRNSRLVHSKKDTPFASYYSGRSYYEGGWLVSRTPTGKTYTPCANEAKAKAELARLSELEAKEEREQLLIDQGDYPHYVMMDTYQRFDVDIMDTCELEEETGASIGMLEDEYGYTEQDYHFMAGADVEWWQEHPERLVLPAHIAIMALDPTSKKIRFEYQEWLDLWEPDWASLNNHANCKDYKAPVIQSTTKLEIPEKTTAESIREVINLVQSKLTDPVQLAVINARESEE